MSYDPTIGSWMETDPDQYIYGMNLYQLELSDPVNRVGPSGQSTTQPSSPTTQPTTQPWNTITWDDFQGTPNPNEPGSDAQAETIMNYSVGYGTFKPDCKGSAGNFRAEATAPEATVTASFLRAKSWVLNQQAKTPSLLTHEQYHYRLAVVGGKVGEKELRAVVGNGTGPTRDAAIKAAEDDLKNQIADKFEAFRQEAQGKQDAYDVGTDGSRNAAGQAQWQEKIAQWESQGGWN